MKGHRNAFSLLEWLVAAVVILILAAILFPFGFGHGRHEKPRRIVCLSNVKQLGLAFAQYVQDYDMRYPVGPGTHRGGGWAGAIYPYVKSTGVYRCPDDVTPGDSNATPPRYPVSFALNQFLTQTDNEQIAGNTYRGLGGASAKVADPSKTVLLFEVSGSVAAITDSAEGGSARDRTSLAGDGLNLLSYDAADREQAGNSAAVAGNTPGGAQYATGKIGGWNQTAQPAQWAEQPRHEQSANYALVDGHVKYTAPQNVNCVQDGSGKIYWAQK